MSLHRDGEKYLDRVVYVVPEYGWGWVQTVDSVLKPKRNLTPKPFHFHINALTVFANKLVGFEGVIKEKEHIYDTYFCSVIDRYGDNEGHVRDKANSFDLWISKNKIIVIPSDMERIRDWVRMDMQCDSLSGYGTIYPTKSDRPSRYLDNVSVEKSK